MRKSAVIMPALAVLAGVLGFIFRRIEINTVFDQVTGLAERGAAATAIVICLCILFAIIAVTFAVRTSRHLKAEKDYIHAFGVKGFLCLGTSSLLGAGWLVSAVMYIVNKKSAGTLSVIDLIFFLLAVLSAVSVVILARRAYKGSRGSELQYFSVIPSIFFCFWMIVLYKNNAANPVLLSYCYQILAIAAAALSYYYSAGFVFGKSYTGRTIASFLIGIALCVLVLADNVELPVKIMYAVTAINLFMNANVFIRNLKKRGEEKPL